MDGTDQDLEEYPKIEVKDLVENESNPEIVACQDMLTNNDDSESCLSNFYSERGPQKSRSIKLPKTVLNAKAKAFTRSSEKEFS